MISFTTSSRTAALEARIAALEVAAARTQGRGTRTGLTIAIGATVTVPVVFDKPMPSSSYAITQVDLEGAVGVGAAFPILPVLNPTPTGCDIQVRNPGLAIIGAGLTVVVTAQVMP